MGTDTTIDIESPSELIDLVDPPTIVRVVPALVADTNTILYIETKNRPGILYNVNKLMKGLNVKVVSTKLHEAHGKVFVTMYSTYRGGHLPRGIKDMVINSLQHYLSLPSYSDEDSY